MSDAVSSQAVSVHKFRIVKPEILQVIVSLQHKPKYQYPLVITPTYSYLSVWQIYNNTNLLRQRKFHQCNRNFQVSNFEKKFDFISVGQQRETSLVHGLSPDDSHTDTDMGGHGLCYRIPRFLSTTTR